MKMIKEIILIVTIAKSLLGFQSLPVSKFAPAKASFDNPTKTTTFKAQECSGVKSWRLIHNGMAVIDLFYSSGVTQTIYYIFEGDSVQQCLDEIERLHLIDNREFKEELIRK